MVIDYAGQLELTAPYVKDLVDVLVPVPSSQGVPAIVELAGKAQTATWITSWRGQGVDPVKTIETLQVEQQRVGTDMQKAFDELRAAIDPANRVDQ
jgi:hypothetical protein